MESQFRNGTQIYSLSTGPTIPEWLTERARRNLNKRDTAIRHRVELLQDFNMPCASTKIKQSPDGQYVISIGTYPPRIKCYQLSELSLKFERYVDSESVDFVFLGTDYAKLAILGMDRSIEFHAGYGRHETIRVPKFGRAMAYESSNCDLLVCGSGREVYRFNLEEGRFREPLVVWSATSGASSRSASTGNQAPVDGGATCIALSPTHALHAIGGEDGFLRFYDARMEAKHNGIHAFVTLDMNSSTSGYGFYEQGTLGGNNPAEITSVDFDHSGMYIAAGTKAGCVGLYDMRSSKPLHIKEHQYGLPIHTVQFHKGSACVLSADSKLIKLWRSKPSATGGHFQIHNDDDDTNIDAGGGGGGGSNTGDIVSNIEGVGGLSHFMVSGDDKDPKGHNSGLLLCATDQPKMEAFYCPSLGTAPRWCSYLENITEELEEEQKTSSSNDPNSSSTTNNTETTFQDYKFLTRDEVEELNIENLIGTPLLRGYMHGFFIHVSLYNRVRAVAKPFEYEEYRKKKIKEKLEEKHQSRIAPKKKNPQQQPQKRLVNTSLAKELERKAKKQTKTSKLAKHMLEDDRFTTHLFQNPDFEIDEENINFKLRNPSGKAKIRADEDLDSDSEDSRNSEENGFTKVDDEQESWGRPQNDLEEEYYKHDDSQDDVTDNSDEDSGSEDEVALAKVRGEHFSKIQNTSSKKSKKAKSSNKKKNKSQPRLYEANDYDDPKSSALRIGLGDASATHEVRKRSNEISLPLEKRLRLQKEQEQQQSITTEKKMLRNGQGGVVNEISYIPKDTRKKMEEKKQQDNEGRSRRSRRGVKDLKLKKF